MFGIDDLIVGIGGPFVANGLMNLYSSWRNRVQNDRLAQENRTHQLRMQQESFIQQEKIQEKMGALQKELVMINYENQDKLQKQLQDFQAKLQHEITDKHIKNAQELARYNLLGTRQTAAMIAVLQAKMSLRNSFIQDILRSFPLNISPLVILENNGQNLNFLFGGDRKLTDIFDDFSQNPLPLNLIVAPLHVDSHVNMREQVIQQVWDTTYGYIESFFTQQYSRGSSRPVALYNAAWNRNVTPGTHTADTLYYFLKNLPTVVVEPRIDSGKLRFFLSSWSLGFGDNTLQRQEITTEFPVSSLILQKGYERSKKYISMFEKLSNVPKNLDLYLQSCKRNVDMFEFVGETNSTEILPFFHFDSSDSNTVAQGISCGLNVLLAAFSDIHHLLATRQQPLLPSLLDGIFADYKKQANIPTHLLKAYRECYWRLCDESIFLSPDLALEYANIAGKLKGETSAKEGFVRSLQSYCVTHNYNGSDDINEMMRFLSRVATIEDRNYIIALGNYYTRYENIPEQAKNYLREVYDKMLTTEQ